MSADWYYAKDNQQHGPVDTEVLKSLARKGELLPTDLIWREGLPEWTPAAHAKGLFPEVPPAQAQSSPPLAAPLPPPPPVQAPQNVLPLEYSQYSSEPSGKSYHGMAIASLILSIFGLICVGFITGTLAIVFGAIALNGMKRSGNTQGKGMAITGLVIGIIDILFSVVYLIYVFARI